jgi:hypothetical protein
MDATPLNIGFRRALSGNKWDRWVHLVLRRLTRVQLSDSEDVFRWSLTLSGLFPVRSMYLDFLNGHTIYLKKYIWKIKVPPKIRIFMWFLHKKVILSQRTIFKNEICMGALIVVFVIKMRQYNISFSLVLLLRFFGVFQYPTTG